MVKAENDAQINALTFDVPVYAPSFSDVEYPNPAGGVFKPLEHQMAVIQKYHQWSSSRTVPSAVQLFLVSWDHTQIKLGLRPCNRGV